MLISASQNGCSVKEAIDPRPHSLLESSQVITQDDPQFSHLRALLSVNMEQWCSMIQPLLLPRHEITPIIQDIIMEEEHIPMSVEQLDQTNFPL